MFRLFLLLTIISGLFAGEKLISTNLDENGKIIPLVWPNPTKDMPNSTEVSNLEQSIRKIKGKKFKIAIKGDIKTSFTSNGSRQSIDVYDNGEWVATDEVTNAKIVYLKVLVKDRDTATGNDTVTEGYAKIVVPFEKNMRSALTKKMLYSGHFSLIYEIPFKKVSDELGWCDTPELFVEVFTQNRTDDNLASTDSEEVDLDDDGEQDTDSTNNDLFRDLQRQ